MEIVQNMVQADRPICLFSEYRHSDLINQICSHSENSG